jgi:hypothetical protein
MVALKGGLNNLGIVVRFDMKVFQQGNIWGGYIIAPITTVDANHVALVTLCGGGNWNPSVAAEQSLTSSAERGGLSIVNNMEFTDTSADEPSELKPFTSIKPTYRNTIRLASLIKIVRENQQLQSNGIRYRNYLPRAPPKKIANLVQSNFLHYLFLPQSRAPQSRLQHFPCSLLFHQRNQRNALDVNIPLSASLYAAQNIHHRRE